MKKAKMPSAFEREMQNPVFKREFDESYAEFVLAEIILAMMESENKSVRGLAKRLGCHQR